jgi:hypothetical protein
MNVGTWLEKPAVVTNQADERAIHHKGLNPGVDTAPTSPTVKADFVGVPATEAAVTVAEPG